MRLGRSSQVKAKEKVKETRLVEEEGRRMAAMAALDAAVRERDDAEAAEVALLTHSS